MIQLNRTDKYSGNLRLEKLCAIVMLVFVTFDVVTRSIICIFTITINVHFSHYIYSFDVFPTCIDVFVYGA